MSLCNEAPDWFCDQLSWPVEFRVAMESAEIADRTLEAAGVGGWELDVITGALSWTSLTYLIHELEPNQRPALASAIDFYRPDAQPVIAAAVADAINTGAPWDLELPFVTAKGRHIWVRACGRAVRQDGKTVRLTGAFQDVTAKHDIMAQIERLSVVARQMTNAVIITDVRGRTEWINDAFGRLTGYTLDDMLGKAPGHVLQGPDTDPQTVRLIRERLAAGEGFDVEIVNYTRVGEPYWISVICTPLRDNAGRLTGFIAVESDVTARRRAEAQVLREMKERERAEALLKDVLEALPSAVTAYDSAERLILTNRAYGEMFPISAAFATAGRPLEELIRFGVANGQYPEAGSMPADQERWIQVCLAAHRAVGKSRTLILPNGHFVQASERRSASGNLVCIRSDTTDMKRAEIELRTLADQDSMTGLANRAAFMTALNRCLDFEPGRVSRGGALMLLDVDHFKSINDTRGHDVGDALLIEISSRLRTLTRTADLPARLGGDEFVVLLPGLIDRNHITARMSAIQAALAAPMDIAGQRLSVTTSAGVALFPQDGATPERLLKTADLALYEAKRTGRARWCLFQPKQAVVAERALSLKHSLRDALAGGDIRVALQPQRRLSGDHAGFEALEQWYDGQNWVCPADFVEDEHGMAAPIGRFVLHTALDRFRTLKNRGFDPVRLIRRIAAAQLLEEDFLADISTTLCRHRLAPKHLEFQVTEAALTGRVADRVETVLRECVSMGISLSIDNFGTAPVPLVRLCKLPIKRVRFECPSVDDIHNLGEGAIVARTIIAMARGLEMESVATGVDAQEQLTFLEAVGCDAAQGTLFGETLRSLDEAGIYLKSQVRTTIAAKGNLARTG